MKESEFAEGENMQVETNTTKDEGVAA